MDNLELQKRNIPTPRQSRKRAAILDALRRTTAHPSACELYEALHPAIPDLSLATVYRNLALFCSSGEAVSVATVSGEERYDGNTAPHAHFVCERCGAVTDVGGIPSSGLLLSDVPDAFRKRITGLSVTYYGVCENCE